jgi:phosphatidylethanolamine/phosphatidyl-N-methylethanolamine N-methyltransferase
MNLDEQRPLGREPIPGIPVAYRLFFQESMRSLGLTASLLPSSRYLAAALLRPIDFRRARTLVELGPGTGAITSAILRRLRPDARLFAIDINPTFVNHLRETCDDPRLIPLCGCATELSSLLAPYDSGPVNAVVSSLGLTTMNHRTRMLVLRQIRARLASNGTLTQYQYVHASAGHLDIPKLKFSRFNEADFLRSFFGDVSVGHVILNFPPAFVFTCHK